MDWRRGKAFLKRHWRAATCAAVALLLAAGALALRAWMLAQEIPPSLVAQFYPSRCAYDGHGNLIDVSRGGGYQWRLPVTLEEIPPEMVADVIAVEDRRFYEHNGVDGLSVFRALWQLLRHRHVVSGASTLTMQLVNQFEEKPRHRSLVYKLRQCGRAWNWERTHTKREILEEYFNRLPYGGAVTGVQAASQFYFGRPVSQLNRSEQLLLTGLPQGPNLYRPDRHPERAIRRRDTVLAILQRAGRLTAEEAAAVKALPVRYRDFSVPAWPHSDEALFLDRAAAENALCPPGTPLRTTLWPEVQQAARQRVSEQCGRLEGVSDGAVVVIENATGKVRAMVGGAEGGDPRAAYVNAALAWRSPGSLLKPFIYGEAVNGGMITADTRLDDSPLEFEGYRPANADGRYRGRVTATVALADSLNTPAIRLLRRVTVPRMLERLEPLELFEMDGKASPEEAREALAKRAGLSLALGGLESRLLPMAAAYASMGRVRPARFTEGITTAEEGGRYWQEGTAELVLWMLASHQLPRFGGRAAWKTGTSNGNRDAWCIAVTPRWTVGVWLGNKDGRPSDALVGATAAAPVAGALMTFLHQGELPDWRGMETHLDTVMLCAESGLAPSPFCARVQPGVAVVDIPLARCQSCRGTVAAPLKETKVVVPAPGTYRRSGGAAVLKVFVEADPAPCHYYLDGRYLGLRENGAALEIPPGRHRLMAWPGEGYCGNDILLEVK